MNCRFPADVRIGWGAIHRDRPERPGIGYPTPPACSNITFMALDIPLKVKINVITINSASNPPSKRENIISLIPNTGTGYNINNVVTTIATNAGVHRYSAGKGPIFGRARTTQLRSDILYDG
jgi:hypothetical protein